jgi:enoyl-CoA hydratase/carnithine racemase
MDIYICIDSCIEIFFFVVVFFCCVGSSYHLPRAIGSSMSNELLLTGNFLSGERAQQIGLVSSVFDTVESMNAAARQLAIQMCSNSRLGLRLTKELINHANDGMSLEQVIKMEDRQQVQTTNIYTCTCTCTYTYTSTCI